MLEYKYLLCRNTKYITLFSFKLQTHVQNYAKIQYRFLTTIINFSINVIDVQNIGRYSVDDAVEVSRLKSHN